MEKKYITISELANKFNKTYTQAWYAVKTGKIKSTKIGWIFLIDINDIPTDWPTKGK
jgi:hypothetical protein